MPKSLSEDYPTVQPLPAKRGSQKVSSRKTCTSVALRGEDCVYGAIWNEGALITLMFTLFRGGLSRFESRLIERGANCGFYIQFNLLKY